MLMLMVRDGKEATSAQRVMAVGKEVFGVGFCFWFRLVFKGLKIWYVKTEGPPVLFCATGGGSSGVLPMDRVISSQHRGCAIYGQCLQGREEWAWVHTYGCTHCMHIHTWTYTCIHIYIHRYTAIRTHIHMHTHTYISIYTHTYTHMYT